MSNSEVSSRPVILVVDDTPNNLALASAVLEDEFRVRVANSGEKALSIIMSDTPPDLVLLDILMPGMDGYEVCRRIKMDAGVRDLPVIFLTAMSDPEDERRGLELGAVDYIMKPISPAILLARVHTHLKLKAWADFLQDKNAFLESEVRRRTGEVLAVQEVTILGLASLAETRDNDTGNHLRRTQRYVHELAKYLKDQGHYPDQLDNAFLDMVFKSAPLHDIGKVGIPDAILLKPGKLDPDEFEIMKRHSRLGFEALENAERMLGKSVAFLDTAKMITLSHHEKWDGSGYPDRRAGTDIPLCARIMAVADVYDALISKRVYKDELKADRAAAIIREGSGTHFDPVIVEAFEALESRFREIAVEYADL